ncbi:hemerythrin domain-containing protein [Eubacterium pyruvativorans]|uniref:hemerythrin domain-containing protein n=1 Tax=Eubacterium pyruvativorans TaxID=155865 RepID=UPI0013D285E6|nr:hemerythrin domain-containing protein [Eubacterium pyruvativorans]
MYCIDIMKEEHRNISYMLSAIRKACVAILDGGEVNDGEMRRMIDFTRSYADHYHHGKEEKFLFPEMERELGMIGESLIRHGMLVEHDLGRAHVADWEAALDLYRQDPKTEHKLDILTGAMGYADLLNRHVEKENNVVYTFAEDKLSEAARTGIDEKARNFEEDPASSEVREKYLTFLDEMMQKYSISRK